MRAVESCAFSSCRDVDRAELELEFCLRKCAILRRRQSTCSMGFCDNGAHICMWMREIECALISHAWILSITGRQKLEASLAPPVNLRGILV